MVHVTINGKAVSVPEGTTILDAARSVHIDIPTLCYLKDVHQYGSCRICVVEVEGMKNLQASCMAKVREGMVIHTNSAKVRRQRKLLYELMLSNHSKDCLSCARNQNCELQALGERLGVSECRLGGGTHPTDGGLLPLYHPRHLQVHSVPPLRHRLQADSACGRHRRAEPRL